MEWMLEEGVTEKKGSTLPETSNMVPKYLEPLVKWCRPCGAGHRVLAAWIEEAGVGRSESSLLSVCLLCSSTQQRGEAISCPPVEDTGSGGERAFPKPTARKAWPSTQHPLELCPLQTSCLPRASSLLSPAARPSSWSLALLLPLLLPP